MNIPSQQIAVELVGADRLELNALKPVAQPGPRQILARVDAVGLCFSDLKLLKQFSAHPRKGPVVSGMGADALASIPSYKPGEAPTVPGHEVVCTIVAVGEGVRRFSAGQRMLAQADYRRLKTASSNAALGYNFEGGLQQYVVFDERVVVDPETDESFLIPVPEGLSASAAALVEPWACVENSYVSSDRKTVKSGGRLLVVTRDGRKAAGLEGCFSPEGKPAETTTIETGPDNRAALARLAGLPDGRFDDIIYFGSDKSDIEVLGDKLAAGGVINLVLGGSRIGELVSVGVGRVHYGFTRWIGTEGADASESYRAIPPNGDVRDGDTVAVVGAAGPMGQMHTIRLVCSGRRIEVVAADLDAPRLDSLARKAAPLAAERGVSLDIVNTRENPLAGERTYFALMVPVASLVQTAIEQSAQGARINIFAGIPAPVKHELDLDRYIARRCYMFGTSGSTLSDMHAVLGHLASGRLDTNVSVEAVGGMAGAIDGIKAVEKRTITGKIVIYPALADMPLTPLADIAPDGGVWTLEAERRLLEGTSHA